MLTSFTLGENRQIEAMCRSIFTLKELVETIVAPPPSGRRLLLSKADIAKQDVVKQRLVEKFGPSFKGIPHKRKASYMSFLLWSYLNTQSTALEIGTGTLHSDEDGLQLFEALAVIGKEEIDLYFCEDERFLDVSSVLINGKEIGMTHDEAVFVYDIFIPIVEKLALDHFPSTNAGVQSFGVIASTCSEFMARAMKQWDTGQSHLNRFRNNVAVRCLSALKEKLSPIAKSNPSFTLDQLHRLERTLASVSETGLNFLEAGMSHDSEMAKYNTLYKSENEKNAEFNSFIEHVETAYLGQNTIKAQLAPLDYPTGSSKKDAPFQPQDLYDSSEKPGTLPLGPEFQHLVALFCTFGKKATTLNPVRLGVLVRLWKAHSYIAATASARDLESFNNTTEKALQIMLAAIENAQHVSFENADPKIDVQDQIVKSGALLDISFLMGSSSSSVQIEAISCLAAVMEGGNMQAQRIFVKYFLDTREEMFFSNASNLLQLASESISEIRILRRQKEDADRAQDNLRKTMSGTIKALQRQSKEGGGSTQKGKGKYAMPDFADGDESKVSLVTTLGRTSTAEGFNLDHPSYNAGAEAANRTTKDPSEMVVSAKDPLDLGDGSHGHYEVLLIVLQAMCEGNNKIIQNYLRDQVRERRCQHVWTVLAVTTACLAWLRCALLLINISDVR